jgi:hypothetical protein
LGQPNFFSLQLHTSQHIWKKPQPEMGPPGTPTDVAKLGFHRDIAEMTSSLGPGLMPRTEIKVMFYLSDCSTLGCGQTWVARGLGRTHCRFELPLVYRSYQVR